MSRQYYSLLLQTYDYDVHTLDTGTIWELYDHPDYGEYDYRIDMLVTMSRVLHVLDSAHTVLIVVVDRDALVLIDRDALILFTDDSTRSISVNDLATCTKRDC
jgi:hypothetical protein